jgi:hypothetical protein
MSFLIKVDDEFLPESEIMSNLSFLEDAVRLDKIDLSTTDGAVSIIFQGEELLGVDFWDEINIPVGFMTGALPQLLKGKPIERYFPVLAYWIKLIPQNSKVLYKVEVERQQRITHIVRVLPLLEFAQEFELLFWRMMRILARLGARSPQATIIDWRDVVEKHQHVNDLNVLQWVIEQPLEIVLKERWSLD